MNTSNETLEAPLLNPVEARILGALMEKRWTTPDAYPMTLNALVTACNQKTSRHPVMHLEPGEVGHALNLLRDRGLVHSSLSARAERFEHKMAGALNAQKPELGILCVLMLRGPQTAGELRGNSARLADFDNLDSVQATLRTLMERERPLVVKLAAGPGRREERYAHLLCGEPELDQPASTAGATTAPDRVAELEREVQKLRAELEALWELSGLMDKRPDIDNSE